MKYIVLQIVIIFIKIIYFFIKLLPTQNKITMISRQSNDMSLDFKLLKNEIEKHNKYKVVVLCKKLEGKENASLCEKVKYSFHMIRQMYEIATSKVVILDSYCIVVSLLKHKKQLKVIQIWHSVGTMKKFGYGILDQEEGNSSKLAKIMKMHHNYDVVLCAGEGYKTDLARQFNCDENIIEIIPLPRVDLLTDKNYIQKLKNKIYNTYPNLKKKKNIIYCPTFRKDETNFEKHLNELIDAIDYKKYNLIIKLHPLSTTKIKNKNVILDKKFSSIEMISISDYVITDYSCILYEAGILNKPLYFYCFDYEEYNKNRSLNLDYFNDLPGIKSREIKEIIIGITNNNYNYRELNTFIKKYIKINKNSSGEIYKLIEKLTR